MADRRKGLILARKSAGLSQQQLADLMGVNRVTLARWELGENDPSLATALQLAQILRRRVEQLFGDEPVFDRDEVDEARRLASGQSSSSARADATAGRLTHEEVTREQHRS